MQQKFKTAQQYSRDIKIMKCYLKEALKENNELKKMVSHRDQKKTNIENSGFKTYKIDQIVKRAYRTLKQRGIPLKSVFNMADVNYKGQITNEELSEMLSRLKIGLTDKEIQLLVLTMDTTVNGSIELQEFHNFMCSYGVVDNSDETFLKRDQAIKKFSSFLKGKKLTSQKIFDQIDKDLNHYISAEQLYEYLVKNQAKLTEPEIFLVLTYLDPQRKNNITKKTLSNFIGVFDKKDNSDKNNEDFVKEIKKLIEKLKEARVNPIKMFNQADKDKKNGVSTAQLEAAISKALPKQTTLQVKKWIKHINFNNDNIIQKQEFMSTLAVCYTRKQIDAMYQSEGISKTQVNDDQKILHLLHEKIQLSGLTRQDIFKTMDLDDSNAISSSQFLNGLKNLGIHIVNATSLLKMFDKNNSGSIDLKQFVSILGDDEAISQVEIPKRK